MSNSSKRSRSTRRSSTAVVGSKDEKLLARLLESDAADRRARGRRGVPVLASFWGGGASHPWPLAKMNVTWPIAYFIPRSKAAAVKKELSAFRAKTAIAKKTRPRSCAFGARATFSSGTTASSD